MTIRDVRVTMLRLPWADDPWLKGHALGATRDILICEVETSGGVTGMGYLFLFRPGMKSIAACLDECIIPRVKGKDATAIEAIWRDLWTATMTYGRGGIAAMAMSAIDIALWDAVGKRAGLPLHRLWGHYRSQIPIYGSGCFRGAGGDGMIEKALHFVKQGYKAIKMQVAHVHTPAQDLENVRRMREALGPDIDIMIDVNMGWSADVAIEMGRKFEQYDIYWLEEPVPADDFAGYQRIAAALDMRVVGGETHFTRYDLRPFFLNPCLPILQPDPMRGGMTDLRKIAALADTWGITIAPHLFPELNVHLLASIPNGIWCENMGLIDDLWVDPPEIADGMITAPERPGHGLEIQGRGAEIQNLAGTGFRTGGLVCPEITLPQSAGELPENCHVGRQCRYRTPHLRLCRRRPCAQQSHAVSGLQGRGRRRQRRSRERPSRACSAPMAGATCGATASTIICTTTPPCTKRSASLAAMPASASAAMRGKEFTIAAGDVAILPAGTGHQCLSASPDFSVVGAYPPGAKMHVTRPTPENHREGAEDDSAGQTAEHRSGDGRNGPLVRLWNRPGQA